MNHISEYDLIKKYKLLENYEYWRNFNIEIFSKCRLSDFFEIVRDVLLTVNHLLGCYIKYFPKKLCFVPKKCKGAKNSYRDYPTESAGSTQNVKKNCRNIKSPNQNKKFPKKTMFNPKKISEHQIYQSKRKFS
jgi:hypothetical protein